MERIDSHNRHGRRITLLRVTPITTVVAAAAIFLMLEFKMRGKGKAQPIAHGRWKQVKILVAESNL